MAIKNLKNEKETQKTERKALPLVELIKGNFANKKRTVTPNTKEEDGSIISDFKEFGSMLVFTKTADVDTFKFKKYDNQIAPVEEEIPMEIKVIKKVFDNEEIKKLLKPAQLNNIEYITGLFTENKRKIKITDKETGEEKEIERLNRYFNTYPKVNKHVLVRVPLISKEHTEKIAELLKNKHIFSIFKPVKNKKTDKNMIVGFTFIPIKL